MSEILTDFAEAVGKWLESYQLVLRVGDRKVLLVASPNWDPSSNRNNYSNLLSRAHCFPGVCFGRLEQKTSDLLQDEAFGISSSLSDCLPGGRLSGMEYRSCGMPVGDARAELQELFEILSDPQLSVKLFPYCKPRTQGPSAWNVVLREFATLLKQDDQTIFLHVRQRSNRNLDPALVELQSLFSTFSNRNMCGVILDTVGLHYALQRHHNGRREVPEGQFFTCRLLDRRLQSDGLTWLNHGTRMTERQSRGFGISLGTADEFRNQNRSLFRNIGSNLLSWTGVPKGIQLVELFQHTWLPAMRAEFHYYQNHGFPTFWKLGRDPLVGSIAQLDELQQALNDNKQVTIWIPKRTS